MIQEEALAIMKKNIGTGEKEWISKSTDDLTKKELPDMKTIKADARHGRLYIPAYDFIAGQSGIHSVRFFNFRAALACILYIIVIARSASVEVQHRFVHIACIGNFFPLLWSTSLQPVSSIQTPIIRITIRNFFAFHLFLLFPAAGLFGPAGRNSKHRRVKESLFFFLVVDLLFSLCAYGFVLSDNVEYDRKPRNQAQSRRQRLQVR